MTYLASETKLLRLETTGAPYNANTANDAVKSFWSYVTTDSQAAVETAGYFPTPAAYVAAGGVAADAPNLSRGDVIMAVMNNGAGQTPVVQLYAVVQGVSSADASNVIANMFADIQNPQELPASVVFQLGAGVGAMASGGYINKQIPGAPVTPANTAGDIVVAVYSLPANSFDVAGREIDIVAKGHFAANANNKRIKIFIGATAPAVGSAVVGGTAIADTGTVATNGGGWRLEAAVFKTGAAGSNTQEAFHEAAQVGAAVAALLAPQALALAENAAITIAVTINNATTATDAALDGMFVEASN
jgi:hypothetical protein